MQSLCQIRILLIVCGSAEYIVQGADQAKGENHMSYTNPQGQPQGTARHFINKLREILIAEVIAINGYQSHIAHSDIEEIN
jgi:hypothetical protein